MSDSNELGVDEQLTRKGRNIAMTNELELTEQPQSRPTRRAVVATGVKVAYTVPILAASLKLSALGASAISPIGGACAHSTGLNGGCVPACASQPNCNGNNCDGFGGPPGEIPGPCEDCNINPGNLCPCDNYCRPSCFVCAPNSEAATFAGCNAIC